MPCWSIGHKLDRIRKRKIMSAKLAESYCPADNALPVLETTVGSVLRDAADKYPDQLGMVSYGLEPGQRRTWAFRELLEDSVRVARVLLKRFEPGERIAIWANNIPEWALLEYGAGLAGMVVVSVNPGYQAKELEFVLKQSRTTGVFYQREFRGNPMRETLLKVKEGLPDIREAVCFDDWDDFINGEAFAGELPTVDPSDPAQIQYTSGTTGFPKGAVLHHRGLTNNARFCWARMEMKTGDILAHCMPFFHTSGSAACALGPIQYGACNAFLSMFDPNRLLELIENERATHVLGVPVMLTMMMEQPTMKTTDLSSLRVATCGGASVPAALVRKIESVMGLRFSIVYGQTECSPLISVVKLDASAEDKANTVGTTLPQAEAKIVNVQSGQTVPLDTVGEICTRGYLVMQGYFDLPDATASTIDGDGWLHTGDLGTMDERGYICVTGRLKEMVIRGGENLFPAEIESALHEHPSVADVAIIGVPDERWGEEVVAFIRVAGGCTVDKEELRAHVRSLLAAQKTPRNWRFVDAFPTTGSGKVQKFVLREQWENGDFKEDEQT